MCAGGGRALHVRIRRGTPGWSEANASGSATCCQFLAFSRSGRLLVRTFFWGDRWCEPDSDLGSGFLKKRIDVSLCRAAPARSRRGHRRDPMSIAWAFVPLKILDPLEEDPIVVEIFRPKRPTRWFPLWTPRRQRERHGPWAMAGCRSPKLHRRPSSAPSSERHHFCTRLLWIKSSSATAQDSATRIPQLFGRIPQLGFRN